MDSKDSARPVDRPLKRLRNLVNLSHVSRWTIVPMVKNENVAEHSFRVAAISECIAERLIDAGVKVDMLEVLRLALHHDIDEVLSGDIPTPCKRFVDGAAIKAAVEPAPQQARNREKFIVKSADTLDALWSLKMYGIAPHSQCIIDKITAEFDERIESTTIEHGLNVFTYRKIIDEVSTLLLTEAIVPSWMRNGG